MVRVEVSFSNGALRQPGMWGKLLQPGNGIINDLPLNSSDFVTVKQQTRTITLPDYPDGGLLLFGARGYHGAGVLTSCFVLMSIQAGAACDWQFPGFLARYEGRGVQLLAHATDSLTPIYEAVRQAGFNPEGLRSALRQQGIDRQPPTEQPKR